VALSLEQQQQQLNKLKAELANLKKEQSRLDNLSKGGLLKKPDLNSAAGKKILTELTDTTILIKAKQKEYDDLNKTFKEAKADTKTISEVGSADEARKAALAGYGPNQIQQYRNDLAAQLKDKKDKQIAKDNAQKGEVQSQELTTELANAGKDLAQKFDDQQRIDLAAQLNKVYATNLPLNGKYSPDLKAAYQRMLSDKFIRSIDEGKTLSTPDFLTIATAEGTYRSSGGGDELPKPFGQQEIYNRSTAEGVIDSIFTSLNLGREASKTEIDTLYKQLQAEQKKLSSISKGTYKMVNGRRVLVQESGLDARTFLENKVKELPAYKESQAAKSEKTKNTLAATALANGYNLETDFALQLPGWLEAVNNGKSIDEFQNVIRANARRSLPEAVRNQIPPTEDLGTTFSTYLSKWSKSRGLPINYANLSKVIPLAYNDKGFATDKEFTIANRSQPDWEGGPEAIDIYSRLVNDTLKDFGMIGQGVRTV
jgi:hypothetical protein